jgi:hypothetical protein
MINRLLFAAMKLDIMPSNCRAKSKPIAPGKCEIRKQPIPPGRISEESGLERTIGGRSFGEIRGNTTDLSATILRLKNHLVGLA